MKAGQLRQLAAIEQLVVTQDPDTGAIVETWEFFCEAWVGVFMLTGREFIAAQATQAGVTTRIEMRYRDGILPTMRVNHRGALYNIRAVLPDPTQARQINLMCEYGVNNG